MYFKTARRKDSDCLSGGDMKRTQLPPCSWVLAQPLQSRAGCSAMFWQTTSGTKLPDNYCSGKRHMYRPMGWGGFPSQCSPLVWCNSPRRDNFSARTQGLDRSYFHVSSRISLIRETMREIPYPRSCWYYLYLIFQYNHLSSCLFLPHLCSVLPEQTDEPHSPSFHSRTP